MDIGINSWFNHWLASWLAQHPTFAWLVGHPWLSASVTLILLIFLVRFLVAIYRLVINTIDRLWPRPPHASREKQSLLYKANRRPDHRFAE